MEYFCCSLTNLCWFQLYLPRGCDASLFLDADDGEKESPPSEALKGFDVIEIIKSKLEEACPAVVSCAGIIVLVVRDSVVLVIFSLYSLFFYFSVDL